MDTLVLFTMVTTGIFLICDFPRLPDVDMREEVKGNLTNETQMGKKRKPKYKKRFTL